MKIERLVLEGYKRFNLRKIKRLDYTPGKKTQVILGSNGSGKSSLMEELSPLPANKDDFERDGCKEVWISHRGNSYHLVSQFSPDGNQFIFEMNGENLNHGLLVTGYRDLVKTHFSYTKEIHAIVIGKTQFHEMSVNDRRNLFMMLQDADFDYAFSYFKRLKDKHRDLTGALKRTQERLAQEQTKFLTVEEKTLYEQESDRLTAEIDHLIKIRPAQLNSTEDMGKIDAELSRVVGELEAMSRQYQSAFNGDMISESKASMVDRLAELRMSHGTMEKELSLRYDTQAALQKRLGEFEGVGDANLTDITAQLDTVTVKIGRIDQLLEGYVRVEDPSATLNALNYRSDFLCDLSVRLSDRSSREVDRDAYLGRRTALEDVRNRLTGILQKQEAAMVELRLLNEKLQQPKANCPACKHSWTPDYDADRHKSLSVFVDESTQAVMVLRQTEAELLAYLTNMDEVIAIFGDFDIVLSRTPELRVFLHDLKDKAFLTTHPSAIPEQINAYRQRLLMMVEQETLLREKAALQKTQTLLTNINEKDRKAIEFNLTQENEIVERLVRERAQIARSISWLQERLALAEQIQELTHKVRRMQQHRVKFAGALATDYIRKAMDVAIHDASVRRSEIERRLSQVELQVKLVLGLQEEIESLKTDIELLGLSIQTLSPSSGLIAKGMTLFINSFLDDVNGFIDRVWTYPLALAPVTPSGEEDLNLDYKFDIHVNGKKVSPDVKETSAGMKEIINLAFAITTMRYLHLTDYPIFLDEFAVKMDSAHRNSAYRVIDYLIESSDFSQLFLISHYENGYSNLTDAELLVLCPSNVVLPSHLKYNEHAQMD